MERSKRCWEMTATVFAGALLGVDDPVGGGEGDVDRLLDDDVLARVQGRHGAVGVHAAGRADGDGVDVVATQHRVQVGGGLGP